MSRTIQFNPVANTHKTKAVSTTAVSLATLGVALSPASQFVAIQAEGGDVRYTLEGTAPSATVGYLLRQADAPLILSRAEADLAKFYAQDGSATLQLNEYYS